MNFLDDIFILENIKQNLESFLNEIAIVTIEPVTMALTIKPYLPPNSGSTGVFLSRLRHVNWNDIEISHQYKVILQNWIIDIDDVDEYGDNWCLAWMKGKFNLIDHCERWRNKYDY